MEFEFVFSVFIILLRVKISVSHSSSCYTFSSVFRSLVFLNCFFFLFFDISPIPSIFMLLIIQTENMAKVDEHSL